MPRRRALLASLGTAVVAGCISDEATSPQTDGTATGSPTETEPTETATPGAPEPPSSIDADWPRPGYDAGNSNRTDAPGPTDPIAELWSVTADSQLSQPVLAGETLYVGSRDGAVLAIDARTGEERWRQSIGDAAFTPRVVTERLCVPTASAIVALDPAEGSEQWRVETPNRADRVDREGKIVEATLLAASHGLYWVAGEGHRNEENPTVVSIAPMDGSEQWRTDIEDPWSRRLFASADAVFVSTNHNAPDPWRLAAATGVVETEPPGSGADFEDEWFSRDGTLYSVGPIFGPVEATPADGGHDWSTDLFGNALSGGVDAVYGDLSDGEQRGLYALAAADGSRRWNVTDVATPVSRSVVAGECVLLRTEEALRCFDPTDGAERWSHPVDNIGGRVVVADDLLYTTRGETVRAFR
ncbi:MAG: PQQ-binding-like beta-propeller repeat protein [Halolamina sp.]|uniref:PQQ-binding-like beta-propeller repeat protein n=1 Tax=Halolamina sp. TaxID=1940283 RepID=UPI002FC2CBBD